MTRDILHEIPVALDIGIAEIDSQHRQLQTLLERLRQSTDKRYGFAADAICPTSSSRDALRIARSTAEANSVERLSNVLLSVLILVLFLLALRGRAQVVAVPKEGLEPSRGVASADFESAASAIPPPRQIR